jgi:methanogenic corrinoid protein MtbC1
MQDNIDVNLLIQSFSEKITQLTNDLIIKDTIIKQLNVQIENLIEQLNENDKEEK